MDVLFINRSYWPDAEATGQLLTELCEDAARIENLNVSVICGQPNFNLEQVDYLQTGTEIRNNVTVHRVRHTRFNKATFVGRVTNFITFLLAALRKAFFCKRPDLIIVQTDPPLLCLLGWMISTVRRTKLICYLQDIYPDIAIELGRLKYNRFTRLLRWSFLFVYRRSDRVVVVGRDMQNWLINHLIRKERIRVIENWVDPELVRPVKTNNRFRCDHHLEGKFVSMYSGNLGFTQRFDLVLQAADQLRDHENIVFVFVGNGVKRGELNKEVQRRGLSNVLFVEYQPRSRLAESLSAADVHFVLLDGRLTQYMMPSKIYGALASGTPVIGIGGEQSMLADRPMTSHLAEIIESNHSGFFVSEHTPEQIVEKILQLYNDPELCESMKRNARLAAVSRYSRGRAINSFFELFCEVEQSYANRLPENALSRSALEPAVETELVARDFFVR